MALTIEDRAKLRADLQQAVIACSERCLYFAAKWAAELLNSLSDPDSEATLGAEGSDTDIDDDAESPPTTAQSRQSNSREAKLEARENSKYLMAKSFFDCREYDRCAAVFLPNPLPHSSPVHPILSPSSKAQMTPDARHLQSPHIQKSARLPSASAAKRLSQKALFLALYARYLAGEKRKNEDSETILGPADGPSTLNKELPGILAILEEHFNSKGGLHQSDDSQGWLDYLYGLCLLKAKSEDLAKQWLLRSVNRNPWNWSAWLELTSLIGSVAEMQHIKPQLPRHLMILFFHVHCSQELYLQTADVYQNLSLLESYFPSSAFLIQQRALLACHSQDDDTSMQLFDSLLTNHPHRLDGLETYSNLLYVVPNRAKLATLAAVTSETDKFRPETNCILGNYYSMRSEHEKAILHFRRALTLDRNFQSAWTLMGHEYIELKNTQAAIESYRRAVDFNRKDYRPWYGLGQGYEMLECYSYSLFYYQRAAALRPTDPKMWAAVANAFARCGKVANAIQAYKRALVVGSQVDSGAASSFGSMGGSGDPLAHIVGGALDPQILYDIALLYEREGLEGEAAAYMELTLAQEEGNVDDSGGSGNDASGATGGIGVTMITSRARLWLARFSYKHGDWQRTMTLANDLCQDGVEVEDAKSLVRDVRARLNMAEEGEEGDEGGESMVA